MFSLLRAYRHIHNLLASVCSGLDHFVVQFGTCWAATGLVHFCASARKPFSIKHTFCKQHQIFGVDDFFTKVINSRGFVLFFSW